MGKEASVKSTIMGDAGRREDAEEPSTW